jgi:hypothetical protein
VEYLKHAGGLEEVSKVMEKAQLVKLEQILIDDGRRTADIYIFDHKNHMQWIISSHQITLTADYVGDVEMGKLMALVELNRVLGELL